MYWKNKLILMTLALGLLTGCSSLENGFLGFSPKGDRREYVHARDLFDAGQYEQAIGELSSYVYKTKNVKRREARAYRLLGQSYEQLGQPDKALEVYLEALEFHPRNVPLLLAAAQLYQNSDLFDQAQDLFERVLKEEPEELDALSGLAHNYHLVGFDSKSREVYDQFFKLNPTADPIYRARYAQTFLSQHKYEEAFGHITMALAQETNNPDFWFISAQALFGQNKIEEALKNLDTALTLAPARHDLLATKALWLYQEAQYNKSLAVTQQILQLTPDNQLALFIQAMNLRKQGQKNRAKKLLTQVKTLNETSFIGKVAAEILSL